MKAKTFFINLSSLASVVALLVCVVTPLLVFSGGMTKESYHVWFNWATLAWFVFSPFWIVPAVFGKSWEEAGHEALLRPGADKNRLEG